MIFKALISSFWKKSGRRVSLAKVSKDEPRVKSPLFLPKLVSIPQNAIKYCGGIPYCFSSFFNMGKWRKNILRPFLTLYSGTIISKYSWKPRRNSGCFLSKAITLGFSCTFLKKLSKVFLVMPFSLALIRKSFSQDDVSSARTGREKNINAPTIISTMRIITYSFIVWSITILG